MYDAQSQYLVEEKTLKSMTTLALKISWMASLPLVIL